MTIKVYTAGSISLTEIEDEFGGQVGPAVPPATRMPIPLSQYYAGGTYVPAGTLGYPGGTSTAIPSSGPISLGNFYGAQNAFVFTYILAAGNYATNLNVLNAAVAAGFVNSGSSPKLIANITINGVLGATNTSNYAFETGTGYSKTPTINVTVGSTGYITGAGGDDTAVRSGYGGHGMYVVTPITLANYGVIQGGGGTGGYGRNNIRGGGAGYNPGLGYQSRPGSWNWPPTGSLVSGGGFQDDSTTTGGDNGGAGGGWVDGTALNLSPSTDGWGYGQPGTGGSPGTYHGGGGPGIPLSVANSNILAGSVKGIIRGARNPLMSLTSTGCVGFTLVTTYTDCWGDIYTTSQPNSAGCGYEPTCPSPEMMITLHDMTVMPAGELLPDMMVYTMHETTGIWGSYKVTAVKMATAERWLARFGNGAEFIGTYNHKFMTDSGWRNLDTLSIGDRVLTGDHQYTDIVELGFKDTGDVVKITVDDAHTYLAAGLLSHNIKQIAP